KPIAATQSSNGCNCARKSSGIGGRCALYASNSSSRNVLPGASKTMPISSGSSSLRSFCSMLSTPKTAPVGSPFEFDSGGSAWKARYKYEDASTRTSLRGALIDCPTVAIAMVEPDRAGLPACVCRSRVRRESHGDCVAASHVVFPPFRLHRRQRQVERSPDQCARGDRAARFGHKRKGKAQAALPS